MAHLRESILDALAARIGTNGVTVDRSRTYPPDGSELPRYMVYVLDEGALWGEVMGAVHREMRVSVAVRVESTAADVEDTMNDHCEYIEDRLNPQGSVSDTLWTRVVSTDFDVTERGNKVFGQATLTVEVRYATLTAQSNTSGI